MQRHRRDPAILLLTNSQKGEIRLPDPPPRPTPGLLPGGPPDFQPVRYHLWRPKYPTPASGICLDNSLFWFRLHYARQGGIPCVGLEQGCEACSCGMRIMHHGYIGVCNPESQKLGILEVTHKSYHDCPVFARLGAVLRGRRLSVCRSAAYSKSPLRVEVSEEVFAGQLPQAFDVPAALYRIWGIQVSGTGFIRLPRPVRKKGGNT